MPCLSNSPFTAHTLRLIHNDMLAMMTSSMLRLIVRMFELHLIVGMQGLHPLKI